jgi:small redox-active disulfide protein 2
MEIKVLGPGCARCNEAEQLVKDVLAAKGVAASVMKISDLKDMMAAGIMSTPAVAIDGVVKSTGKIPSKEEIAAWIDGGSASAHTPQGGGGCCGGKC